MESVTRRAPRKNTLGTGIAVEVVDKYKGKGLESGLSVSFGKKIVPLETEIVSVPPAAFVHAGLFAFLPAEARSLVIRAFESEAGFLRGNNPLSFNRYLFVRPRCYNSPQTSPPPTKSTIH